MARAPGKLQEKSLTALVEEMKEAHVAKKLGDEMLQLIAELFPICRSITGQGYRDSLKVLKEHIPIEIQEVATGTQVLDWTIPKEWNISDAYIKDSAGNRIVDFRESNLHVVSYSVPVHKRMSLEELKPHLHSLPEQPKLIPYRTSYYNETWGFCVPHELLLEMKDDTYEVSIDSSLEVGSLTFGELVLRGEEVDEVLISSHACHPSLCNDNLSGVAVSVFLAKRLSELSTKLTYRFLFAPATIGAITWLAQNEDDVGRIRHGLILACVGDPGPSTYKKSRRGDAEIDQAVSHVLRDSDSDYKIVDFSPYGYDERQYCSPGFDLPVGSLMRTPNGEFPEYHTSADNLEFVQSEFLADTYSKCLRIVDVLERNAFYLNKYPKGEPQLGRRGLYRSIGGEDIDLDPLAMLWVLNYSDGSHSLLDIADLSELPFGSLRGAADLLEEHGLIELTDGPGP